MSLTNTVHIIAGKETKAKLIALGKAFVNCWNEVNTLKLEQYMRRAVLLKNAREGLAREVVESL